MMTARHAGLLYVRVFVTVVDTTSLTDAVLLLLLLLLQQQQQQQLIMMMMMPVTVLCVSYLYSSVWQK